MADFNNNLHFSFASFNEIVVVFQNVPNLLNIPFHSLNNYCVHYGEEMNKLFTLQSESHLI